MARPENPETGMPPGSAFLPEVPRELARRRLSLRTIVLFFGPGAIIASLTVGSGETVLASRLGAVFGYAILWLVLVGAVTKAAIIYASNRYIVLTGEHPMSGLAKAIPGPRGWFPALIGALAVLSFPFVASALATGIGSYLEIVFGGPAVAWGLVLLVLAAALAWFGWYALLERAQVAIVSLKVALVVVAVFAAQPQWLDVVAGFVPQGFGYEPFVFTEYPDIADRSVWIEAVVFMGGLGGGMYDYIGYAGLMREKRWGALGLPGRERAVEPLALDDTPQERERVRGWSRAPLGDVVLSFTAMALTAIAFVITGTEILGAAHNVPNGQNVLTYQGDVLGVIHPVFRYFYVLAIIMVFFGTMYAIWEVYSRTTYESLSAVSGKVRTAGIGTTRTVVYAYILLGGAALILTGADLVALITPANIVGGTLACGIYGLGLLVLERRVLPAALRTRPAARVLVALSSVVLLGAGLVALGQYVGVLQ
ncbi:Nramp family divalent metal transporter [Pseudonocardia adelaidensis]|uniref:Natural resistance-associated macrophage protein n=1 Tax=Pseudonocardia adelaidensis TaxID=648754 RepID=A0ABP9NU44_9PSEU